ncbi:MAG: hypothetical protein KatS3mg129_1003 [Leptospiraceae bacterium]|nr:MAG: hypothetical protein KatS3mg129_1003 [Leptospiraceae bacterium]
MKWIKTNYIQKLILSGKLFYFIVFLLVSISSFILFYKKNYIQSNFLSLEGKNILIPVKLISYQRKIKNQSKKIEKNDHQLNTNNNNIGSEGKLKDSYIAKVLSKIEKNKRYPKIELLMEREGFVKVYIELDRKGTIKQINIIKGTNENFIKEAIRAIKISAPFEPLPEEFQDKLSFILNVKFILQ